MWIGGRNVKFMFRFASFLHDFSKLLHEIFIFMSEWNKNVIKWVLVPQADFITCKLVLSNLNELKYLP